MKKIINLNWCFILLLLLIINCKPGQKTADTNEITPSSPITITDYKGRQVTIKRPVKKIAFSHFSTGEALKIINAWNLVAGRSPKLDKNIFPDVNQIPIITSEQNVYDLNYEKIFEQGIDLFLAIDIPMNGFDTLVSRLEPDIPVVALNFDEKPVVMRENLVKLGRILGKEKEAAEYIEWFDQVLEKISRQTASLTDREKPNVVFKTGWGGVDDIQTFTKEFPGMKQLNQITGSINVTRDLTAIGGWVQDVDPEWLAGQTIDVLVSFDVIPGGYGIGINDQSIVRQHRERTMQYPAYSSSNAVRDNRVHMATGELFGTPRFIIGYAYMAKWFHPDRLIDFDPQAVYQEYMTRFLRIDIDLSSQGVFVYPQ